MYWQQWFGGSEDLVNSNLLIAWINSEDPQKFLQIWLTPLLE